MVGPPDGALRGRARHTAGVNGIRLSALIGLLLGGSPVFFTGRGELPSGRGGPDCAGQPRDRLVMRRHPAQRADHPLREPERRHRVQIEAGAYGAFL